MPPEGKHSVSGNVPGAKTIMEAALVKVSGKKRDRDKTVCDVDPCSL